MCKFTENAKNNILFDIAAIIYAIGIGIVNTRFKA
jgi:hypothetical protein